MLYCPQCAAEYREGNSSCSDCHVLLVRERPTAPSNDNSAPSLGDPNRDPFCSFWQGADARVCAEICTVLDEAGIPHKTVHRQDHLFHFSNQVPYEVGVPASLYEKAELAIKDAFGNDEESGEDAIPLLPAPPPVETPRLRPMDQDPQEWFQEDATAEVWNGNPPELEEIVEMSLKENDIRINWQSRDGKPIVAVLPADEARAREIVRQILESSPFE